MMSSNNGAIVDYSDRNGCGENKRADEGDVHWTQHAKMQHAETADTKECGRKSANDVAQSNAWFQDIIVCTWLDIVAALPLMADRDRERGRGGEESERGGGREKEGCGERGERGRGRVSERENGEIYKYN